MAKIKVTLKKALPERTIRTGNSKGYGLKKATTREYEKTPAIEGMIKSCIPLKR